MKGWKGGRVEGWESGKKNILLTVILTCPHFTNLLQRNAGKQEKWDKWAKL